MAVMTYVCKYTPLELMLAFGAGFEAPNNDVPDFSKSEPLIHQNLCSHAKMLVLDLLRDPDGQNTQAAPASAPQAANQTGSAGSAIGRESDRQCRLRLIGRESDRQCRLRLTGRGLR